MFDTGFWEFFLIAIITLIVVGPDKMPALARSAGKMVGKAKRFIQDTQQSINQELDSEQLKKDMGINDSGNILELVKDTETDIKKNLQETQTDINKNLQ